MPPKDRFPTFGAAFLVLIMLVMIQIIVSIIVYDLGYTFESGDPGATGIITLISCGILITALLQYTGLSYRQLFNDSSNSLLSMLAVLSAPIALVAAGAIFWMSDITALMIHFFPMSEHEAGMFSRLFDGSFESFVTICLIAPFVEEMLFRGVILRGFLSNYSESTAIGLSALLFAIFHLSLYQFPVALLTGVFLAWLYVRTRSLWPCIFSHALYNGLVTLFWLNNREEFEATMRGEIVFSPAAMSGLALMASIAGILLLLKLLKSRPHTLH